MHYNDEPFAMLLDSFAGLFIDSGTKAGCHKKNKRNGLRAQIHELFIRTDKTYILAERQNGL